MGLTKEQELEQDYDRAKRHAEEYIVYIQNQITARGLILNGAMEEFNDFRNLPKTDNTAAAIWDFAFTLLSAAVPALRLGEFIKNANGRATAALKAAESFRAGRARLAQQAIRVNKVVKTTTGALDKLGKVAEKLNSVKDIKEKGEKAFAAPQALAPHKSREPIMTLIHELQDATEMWKTAKKAVAEEWEIRLAGGQNQWGSLENTSQALLPTLPKEFSQSELDEIWTQYLWYMIGKHVENEVVLKKTITMWRGGAQTVETSYQGLNDNQEAKIVELFGVTATRGRIYFRPPIFNAETFYALQNVQTVTVYKNDPGGMMNKM